MIKKEFFKTRKDGINLYRIYSDEDYRIIQEETGNASTPVFRQCCDEAIDVENAKYTYTESEEKIEEEVVIDDGNNTK